jgi:hypothetical protein
MKKRRACRSHKCECQDCSQHLHSHQAQQHKAINRVVATFDEKSRRRFVGLLALQLGRGGMERVHEITGLSRTTIRVGCAEVRRTDRSPSVRRPGGGRIALEKNGLKSWKF